ncbi:hypothetical protein BCR34DRAFT_613085 [Clohesyomyces aquaticus]|uniref:Secreted protein n=1 Tax=Clohesyomyces aquaticus TaxID=1231657 RepID=A0A1Y1ZW20_9PLEO|nr:hypothetical protein BCR34DRAFT_613085 [Clohesyomyces aquaticus]
MVKLFLPTFAALALTVSVAAVPTASNAAAAAPFTFSQWIEDIIANPDGQHLSPEEAVAAKNAAVGAESPANPLLKRKPNCDGFGHANAKNAASCLDYLAKKGAKGTKCEVKQPTQSFCKIGNAEIIGSVSNHYPQSVNCNDVARTGGKIFDSCWRADDTVGGAEWCINNNVIYVILSKV